nr:HtaA domain-containing protein [Agromyces seonyuensis]
MTVKAGSFDPSKTYQVATSAAHGLSITDRSLDAFAPITIKSGTTTPPTTPPTTTPPTTTPVVPPATVIPSGSLTWGVSASFRSYVTGSIAQGAVSVSGGATQSGGVFQFGQSASTFTGSTGSADYFGSVRFTGHSGVLDLTFANPTLRVDSPTVGTLQVTVNGSRVNLATVNLAAASKSTAKGATTFANAPVTLNGEGAAAFDGFYAAGRALDPLTVVIGSAGAAPAGSTGTVAAAPAATPAVAASATVPATPPATTGIRVDDETLAALVGGEEVTISVDGFEPNETDVKVVVYSTPIVLADDLVADAAGVVTWTGKLPAGLEAGQHTLTFQGSTTKGLVFEIEAVEGCVVEGASLDWGFKESFTSYLTSGIANGDWALVNVTEEGSVFSFTGGTGNLDAVTQRGLVAFEGASIEFTGHDGALDTTIANPQLELNGDGTGTLILDVHGTTQDGSAVTAEDVRFAELDLEGALADDDGSLVGTAVPAVLTEDGAAAFGTYAAGEALDPVDFVIPLPADCDLAVAADEEPAAEVEAAAGGDDSAAADVEPVSSTIPAWVIWTVVIVAILLIALITWFLARRRRGRHA